MKPNHRAMTLVEVMMALMVIAMIGAVATSVTVTVLKAHECTDAYSENVQAARMSLGRLQYLIESARLVTEGSPTTMTLWAFDADKPGVINAEEVIRLRFDSDLDAIQQIYFPLPDELSSQEREALNVSLTLAEAMDWSVASELLVQSIIRDTVIASEISAVRFRYDSAPPFTRVVSIEATFGHGAEAATFRTAASLRAPATDWVEIHDSTPMLVKPEGISLVSIDGG